MVKEKIKDNVKLYQCEVCKLYYREKEWAERCQEWCEKHNSCNLEITSHAIKI